MIAIATPFVNLSLERQEPYMPTKEAMLDLPVLKMNHKVTSFSWSHESSSTQNDTDMEEEEEDEDPLMKLCKEFDA